MEGGDGIGEATFSEGSVINVVIGRIRAVFIMCSTIGHGCWTVDGKFFFN